MEKKHKLVLAAASALLMMAAASVSATDAGLPRLTVKQKTAVKKAHRNVASAARRSASPLRLAAEKAQGVTEAVLVNEDFSAFTSGTMDKPDTTQMLACEYAGFSPNGIFIDNSLTKDGTWFGNFVYQAGGAIALKTYNPMQLAYLCTPLGDYSGELTISFRVKANPALASTGTGFNHLSGSSLDIEVCHGGYDSFETSNTDDENGYYSVRLYEKDGWQEVTYTCKNYSANNDGYVCLSTEGSLVIDDMKIKAGSSFLASPVINGLTDFQEDNFTVAWQPTRKAYNYYVDLYTRKYNSENDTTFTADFNDKTLANGWSSTSSTYSDDEGANSTAGLVLRNGDSFTTPTNGNDYKTLHFYVRTVDNTAGISDENASEEVKGTISVDMKTADGWQELGDYNAHSFWHNPMTLKLEGAIESFAADGYTLLRLRVNDLNDGAYMVIDNVDITAKPGFEYKIVSNGVSDKLSDNYAFTGVTKDNSYTFEGLDPNTEYYYGVRAHNVSQFSPRQFIHALGVATPKSKGATDITTSSFTANWSSVAKATGYTADCYGVATLDKDEADYAILEEDFDKIDDSMTEATSLDDAETLDNSELTQLDEYTTRPGWKGYYNNIAQGMLGTDGDWESTGGMLYTPRLDLSNADKCSLTLKIYGDSADQIRVLMNNSLYALTLSDDGTAEGTFEMPVTVGRQRIGFYSSTHAPMMLDYIKVAQDLKKGARVQTWLDAIDTDADATSCTFTGLDAYGFSLYGYEVTSRFQYDDYTEALSLTPSAVTLVDLSKGTSTGIDDASDCDNAKVVARYTANGMRTNAPVKGLNLLKMSNGKVIKTIVK